MVCGVRCTVYGVWWMVHGVWCMGYGVWYMVHGLCLHISPRPHPILIQVKAPEPVDDGC